MNFAKNIIKILFSFVVLDHCGTAALAVSFTNSTAMTITDATCSPSTPGKASLYPSPIIVSGLSGTVTSITVTLFGLTHAFEGDYEVMLVGPGGGSQNLEILSDAGTGPFNNATVIFNDAAASVAPQNGPWAPGTWKPTQYTELSGADVFPAPAPAPSANTTFATAFNGIVPNGTWNLYVVDDACGDAGTMGGWILNIFLGGSAPTTTTVTSSLNPSRSGQLVTFTAAVTNAGVPVTSGTVNFTEGATTLAANVALDGSGRATFSRSTLSEGNHIITGTYNGTAAFATSSSNVNQRVDNNTTITGNTFCNTGPIIIPSFGIGTPYPSHIFVTGLTTSLVDVNVSLKNVTHAFGGDVEVLLVGPAGQNIVLLSDAGTAADSNITLNFDDAAAGKLPQSGVWGAANSTITVQPTDYVELSADIFPAPAPTLTGATNLSTFNGSDPNGTWSLYVLDDGAPDSGTIVGGWCLTITPVPTLRITSVARQPNGHVLLQGTGVTNGVYTMRGTTNVSSSFLPLGTTTANGSGVWQYDDSGSTNLSKRFYRLSYP